MFFLLAFPIGSLMFGFCYLIHNKIGKAYTHPFSLSQFLEELPVEIPAAKTLHVTRDGIHYTEHKPVLFTSMEEIGDIREEMEDVLEEIAEDNEDVEELQDELLEARAHGDEVREEIRKIDAAIEKERFYVSNVEQRIKQMMEEQQKKAEEEELQLSMDQARKTDELTKLAAKNANKTASILQLAQQETIHSDSMRDKLGNLFEDLGAVKKFREFTLHKKGDEMNELGKKSSRGRFFGFMFNKKKSNSRLADMDGMPPGAHPHQEPNLDLQTS